MPKANLAGRFETRMWYITERVEPSRTKDIGGKFAVKKKIGPAGAWDQAGGLLSYRPFPGLCFVPEAHSLLEEADRNRGLSLSGLVPPRLQSREMVI